jgi:hypothetical protein
MVQLSATRCSCIVILCVSLVSFAAITLCVAFIVVSVYFVIDSVRKPLDTPHIDFMNILLKALCTDSRDVAVGLLLLLLRIREVMVSILSSEAGYPGLSFGFFFFVPPGLFLNIVTTTFFHVCNSLLTIILPFDTI